MKNILKEKVLSKINEIYPNISKEDSIVLFGSRAKGFEMKDSDIDIMIFTKNYNYFKKISVKNGFRTMDEDAGFEIPLDNGLHLEVKIAKFIVPKFEVMFYHDILSSKPLTSVRKFKAFQSNVKKEFMKNYDGLLFHSYIHFWNEFKTLEGMSKRKDKLSKINISMKKGVIIQALLRLILVMEKKPYTFDKYLSHEVSQTKDWNKISKFVMRMNKIDSFEDYTKVKVKARDYLDSEMPKKPYVGNWWKFLNEFKGFSL